MLAVIFGTLKSSDRKIQYFPALLKLRVNFVFNVSQRKISWDFVGNRMRLLFAQ